MGKLQLFIERTSWGNISCLLRELHGEITVVYSEKCMVKLQLFIERTAWGNYSC